MKAMSLRISMQTLSPCATPRDLRPEAMRSARSATSSWLRLRLPLMTPWKREVSVICLFIIGAQWFVLVITGLVPVIHVLLLQPSSKTWMAGTSSAKTRFALLPGHDGSSLRESWRALFDIGADGLGLVRAADQLLLLDRLRQERRAGIDGEIVQHALGGADGVRVLAGDIACHFQRGCTRVVHDPGGK